MDLKEIYVLSSDRKNIDILTRCNRKHMFRFFIKQKQRKNRYEAIDNRR